MRALGTVEGLLSWVGHEVARQFLLPWGAWLELFATHPTPPLRIQAGKQRPHIQGAPSLLQHKPPLSVPHFLSFRQTFSVNHLLNNTVHLKGWTETAGKKSFPLTTALTISTSFASKLIASLLTCQQNVCCWEWGFIRMHYPAMPLDWILPTTAVGTVWATIRFFSRVGEKMAL